MKDASKNDDGSMAVADQGTDRDEDAMSQSMRELILSFGTADAERAWDPDAFARRSAPAH